ncbi:LytR/AlgR family response regulator transcription factor [Niabella beijingensis]|uniref:LytR/AlgR family response regulator transcription factor n=1 Tax=Niabella beijingensis TaxID=2872700 RepID=UPI001CBAA884|nr:LytTR family DNA-binding domain-containing protein [Niabella beijingensis]MBZ4189254.1 LytTR family DNA-binding domain-containing protein [Niabella beijingensis]
MIRCIVLDDEPLAVALLKKYILQTEGVTLLAGGTKPGALIPFLEKGMAELVFMDIRMPEQSGMELMDRFNEKNAFVITSAYPKYALEGYHYNVVDYLLKPITYERFLKSIGKFREWTSYYKKEEEPACVYIKESGIQYKIYSNDILYIEGLRDYVRVCTSKRNFVVLTNLKDILRTLPGYQFVRIHRSFIVNMDKLEKIQSHQVMIGIKEIPIGEAFRKAFSAAMDLRNGK